MKILIAFDGSPSSESAVADLRLAGLPPDTEAVIFSVLDSRSCDGRSSSGPKELSGQARLDFSEARDRQLAVAEQGAALVRRLFPSWGVTPEVSIGSPPWEIIQRAEGGSQGEASSFDLVVVGSRGFGEFKRLLLGSVAQRVATTLQGSVRISRGKADRLASASGGDMLGPPRLVVGVDGSNDAHAAVEAVADRSWPCGTRVVMATFETGPLAMVAHWEPHTIWGGAPSLHTEAANDRPATLAVSQAAELVRRRRPDLIVSTLVRPADPKYALLAAAEEWDKDGADCIFVGASGIRGLPRFLLGSVSTSVALNATCSVEIVRRRP